MRTLNFVKADHTRTAILGLVTHQDPKTGKWVRNDPALATTANGWRLDGTANAVLIRNAGAGQHAVTQTFTGFASTGDLIQVDTQYAPCACSPLGKMSSVSLLHAPGATPQWTTYQL